MKTVAIIPAYNEPNHVADVIRGASAYVDSVIVVNDGSSDKTASVAREAGAIVVSHPLNCGAGAATMTGIEAARRLQANVAVTLDADGQHNPEDIPKLLIPVKEGRADIVIGTRFFKGSKNTIPAIRTFFNMGGNVFTYLVTGRYVSDSQSGFKVLGPEALREIQLHLSGFEFCSEIIREIEQHKWRVVEVPIRVTYSEYTLAKGQSFSRGVITACKMLLRSFLR
jgi:glycosyltransferase involved in cell wall biosynthesis